jgi:HIP---CoA ligase
MVPRNIPELALQAAARFGDRPAIVDGECQVSFVEVREEMLGVAASLVAREVQPGDCVAVWAPNCATWIVAALGALASGALLVPLNTRFTAREAAEALRVVDASVLFTVDDFLGRNPLAELQSEAPDLRCLADPVLLPGPGKATRPEWDAFLARSAPEHLQGAVERIAAIRPDDVSDVMFTSGTTGSPKGVMLVHGTTLRLYRALNDLYGVGEGDRCLIALPFFHCFGYKAGWLVDLFAGATTYPLAAFNSKTVMELVERHRITHLPGAPTMLWSLLNDPDRSKYELSSLRASILGGSYIPVELPRRVREELGISRVFNGYGLTENHALISFSRPDDPPELVATTVGQVVDDQEVVTVDDQGRHLPVGVEGELLVRGYARMAGYYGDASATAAAFSDGWLRTGDIGTVDDHGYVRITDRKKDIFITGGFNVAPAEVENVLASSEVIAQVAVVGVPDDRMGEVGAAFVVPVAGEELRPEDVVGYAEGLLANYKLPRYVEVVTELPTNATGKVLKHELRGRFRKAQTDAVGG